MRPLVGTERDALALSRVLEEPEICRRHEALATGEGFEGGGDEIVGVTRRGEHIGGRGGTAGHLEMCSEGVVLNRLRVG